MWIFSSNQAMLSQKTDCKGSRFSLPAMEKPPIQGNWLIMNLYFLAFPNWLPAGLLIIIVFLNHGRSK